ncbi:MAG: phosphoribosylaminoimidazolesuccinocarboxamide synthase [Candidatus Altiarchaeales archaeon]|nr:MAG: phosphoribosylaminoimidazolesuccinocarboxamide synthase [Candidatus Altiarchaeales archaeon]
MKSDVLLKTDLPLKPFMRGKVRDIYDLGNELLMIATDRISAFDSVLPNGIPYKGKVLTGLSVFWFNFTRDIIENHLITANVDEFPDEIRRYSGILEGRSMIVKKAERIDIECVVRGYISGSAWKEYREKGGVCEISLPKGLKESQKLPEPIFTPAIKSKTGHDINISEEKMADLIGNELTERLKRISLQIYEKAFDKANRNGIIIADSKFEFGISNGKPILIDELLTPDSSRFWSLEDYSPGRTQKSFDKQFVRNYLEKIKWNKEPPAPMLPDEIVKRTSQRYLEAYRRITGRDIIK